MMTGQEVLIEYAAVAALTGCGGDTEEAAADAPASTSSSGR